MEYWTVIQPSPATPGQLLYKGEPVGELYLDGSAVFYDLVEPDNE